MRSASLEAGDAEGAPWHALHAERGADGRFDLDFTVGARGATSLRLVP